MTLYNLHCDRCGGTQTHKTTFAGKDYVNAKTHPKNDREVFCRNCERGNSKADLDGETNIWAVAQVEQGVGMSIHPEFIPEDETLEEYIERQLKEEYVGRLAAEIADGIRDSDVEYSYYETEDEY